MAHLTCTAHKLRTLVFSDGWGHTCIVHRADGSDCLSGLRTRVTIGGVMFEPRTRTDALGTATAVNALGRPVLDAPAPIRVGRPRRQRDVYRAGPALTDSLFGELHGARF